MLSRHANTRVHKLYIHNTPYNIHVYSCLTCILYSKSSIYSIYNILWCLVKQDSLKRRGIVLLAVNVEISQWQHRQTIRPVHLTFLFTYYHSVIIYPKSLAFNLTNEPSMVTLLGICSVFLVIINISSARKCCTKKKEEEKKTVSNLCVF